MYQLRVLVFVEYEEEVDAERARVKSLLEKLRIDAEVVVFWLASGSLGTYETIVSGQAPDPTTEALVNGCLQDEEWWDELQSLRDRPKYWSASQELDSLANIVELTAGRPGVFNPHNEPEGHGERRRSMARLTEFPKKPTVSTLARLGVNMGIHTANLLPSVFHSSSESDSESGSESDSDWSKDDRNVDFNEDASAASEGDIEYFEPVRRPLLSTTRRKSHNDVHILEPAAQHKPIEPERFVKTPGPSTTRSYGTMTPLLGDDTDGERAAPSETSDLLSAANTSLSDIRRPATPRRGLSRNTSKEQLNSEIYAPKPKRSTLSRQSSHLRFSSLVPSEADEDAEDERSPMLGGGETDAVKGRPGLSRANSQARFSSRLLPETKITTEGDSGPSVSFAPEPETRPHTMPPSPGEGPVDFSINIPDLVASYQAKARDEDNNDSGDSSGETAGLPLSFNDLPARAQYLILNELLRQNGGDSAVILTTLPIPTEGTCKTEEASVQYLSDVEVLCNELPPTLLVLSNNMT